MGHYALLLAILPVVGVLLYQRQKSKGLPLPPGPTPFPIIGIIGNTLQVSRFMPWLSYTAWAEQFGPLLYVRLLGRDVLIVNSEELAQDLIERRSTIYNDRPHFVTNEFFGIGFNSGFLPYGDRWRFHRRLLHQTFRSAAVPDTMYPIMLRKRRQLVKAIVNSPDECLDVLHTHAASVIMAIVYGYETKAKNDRLVDVVNRMLKFAMHSMTPEREALASTFPIIKYIPTWMPGSQYRRDGLRCRVYCKEMLEAPFEYTVKAMASGDAPASMVSDLLSNYVGREDIDMIREAVKGSASTVFGGESPPDGVLALFSRHVSTTAASGTTDTAILCFILAMVLYPDVQRRARLEIDRVVEADRLPDFDDRPSLPYVDAVLREVWRWHPPSPLGVPHATCQSDIYNGYYIPKGAMVIINIWAMTRADKYPEPDVFRPERFLTETGALSEDKVLFAFGAGRRTCVGKYFADATVWLTIVTLLSCFEFSKVGPGWGMEDVQWTSGVTVSPHSFPFKLTIRDRAKMVPLEDA